MNNRPISQVAQSFNDHTGTWILSIAFCVAAWMTYSAHRDLNEVCNLAQEANEIAAAAPLDAQGIPISPTDLKAQVEQLKSLGQEHTVDGELWRWQQYDWPKIEAICSPTKGEGE